MPWSCSSTTWRHTSSSSSSVISAVGTRSSESPSIATNASSMASLPMSDTVSSSGVGMSAAVARSDSSASCSTARRSEEVGRSSPVLRRNRARNIRNMRSADRLSWFSTFTKTFWPSVVEPSHGVEPRASTAAGAMSAISMPERASPSISSRRSGAVSGVPKSRATAAPHTTPSPRSVTHATAGTSEKPSVVTKLMPIVHVARRRVDAGRYGMPTTKAATNPASSGSFTAPWASA